ncbi:MAG: hypothetical protein Q9219_002164 [cf. Caloplaca sp. 3 TL-2023]
MSRIFYKWAAAIVASRSFPSSALGLNPRRMNESEPNPSSVLIPGLDLLNHSPTASVVWHWTEKACSMRNDGLLMGGTEIFNNYAPKSNEELVLGYGFSLFKNISDHCNLALGAAAVTRIKGLLNQREQDCIVQSSPQQDRLPIVQSQRNSDANRSLTGIGWVRLVKTNRHDMVTDSTQSPYMFSPYFLGQAYLAFSNTRERMRPVLLGDVDFGTASGSRNQLHTMCAITMMLQKQRIEIIVANAGLPAFPQNERQFHAARYRRSQLFIFHTVIQSLLVELRRRAGLDPSYARDKRIMRLEHILKAGPKEFLQDFRALLHAGLGTRNPEKIRRQGGAEAAFTLWLYGLMLWTSPVHDSGSEMPARTGIPRQTARWITFVQETYGEESEIGNQWTSMKASQEGEFLADSCFHIVQAAATKNSQSLYGQSKADPDRLLWCLRVIREESFMCPGLQGATADENDELMLFLEDGADIVSKPD